MNSRISLSFAYFAALLSVATVTAQDNQPPEAHEPYWVQDNHVIVPRNRMVVTAYSLERNLWSHIEFNSPLSPDVRPSVSQGMVALKDGHTV
jgi:hypothetical protein